MVEHIAKIEEPCGLELVNIGKTFFRPASAPVVALEAVDLVVQPGELVSIVGPSGCGKTTLLRIIQGLDDFTSGSVTFRKGEGTSNWNNGRPRMGFVFQSSSLLPWRTVKKNVRFGLERGRGKLVARTKQARDEIVEDLLETVGLSKFAGHYPSEISGGMQQRTNLCRALAVRPQILLMDEPFGALDALTREQIQRDFAKIAFELGTTVVLITHDIHEAVFLSDRVVVMGSTPGRILETIVVDEPRPRSWEFHRNPSFGSYERRIEKVLGL